LLRNLEGGLGRNWNKRGVRLEPTMGKHNEVHIMCDRDSNDNFSVSIYVLPLRKNFFAFYSWEYFWHVISFYVISRHVTSRHVMSCHVMSCMICHFMSCLVTSCYAFLAIFIAHVFRVGHFTLYLSSECAIVFLSSQHIHNWHDRTTNKHKRKRKKENKTKQNKQTNKQTNKQKQFQCQPYSLAEASKAMEGWKQNFGRQYNELSPQSVNYGKFHNKDALIQALPEGSSDILKEKFSNQARLMMWVNKWSFK